MGSFNRSKIGPAQQRAFAEQLVKKLVDHGYQAVFAGGCVRDQLLGRDPQDYDIATNATPEQVRQALGLRRTLPIGAAFGVVAVLAPRGMSAVEVATFRRDDTYSDGRHPDAVHFSSDYEDAQRRDFTINGMFLDPIAGRVLDYVGGQEDLARRVIRAIGDPEARFAEDHLRMLRAIRFTVKLGFELHPDTLRAIQRLAHRIVDVSAERVANELRMMWSDPRCGEAVALMFTSGLLEHIWPELGVIAKLSSPEDAAPAVPGSVAALSSESGSAAGATANPWHFALAVLSRLTVPDLPLVAAVLAHHGLSINDELADHIAELLSERWRLASDESDAIRWLIENHKLLLDADRQPWPRVQRVLINARARSLVDWCRAELEASGRPLHPVQFCLERLQWPMERLNPPPLVTGHDLLELGIPRGPWYKRLLDRLRDEQLTGELTDRQAARLRASELWRMEQLNAEAEARDTG